MRIGIVGCGHVGTAMKKRFPDAVIYDEPKQIGTKDEINECEIAFICVPTPAKSDGSCDVSIVESVLSWVQCKTIVIRSTVPIGFTSSMVLKLGKDIVFQPEYYGETNAHPFSDLANQNWISLGGSVDAVNRVVNFYQKYVSAETHFYIADSNTVELAKYLTNAFLATKVIFCNEMYDLADKLGVNYNVLREIWLADPRIGNSHTFVYPENRGYGGSCFPKDTSALLCIGEEAGADMTLLESVIRKNQLLRKEQNDS
ncbi:hypothetical protein [uncultured Ruminococcus sp.]|uniref:hypothetical protein n=1 Tax=uncultured Ruminococcus sp. TaxID=165186 RepID=UPI0025FD8854|nr:hypothetical protein [uncultured Ruminococcus sp.]